jgi:chemotaxis protein methyltransferase CheR
MRGWGRRVLPCDSFDRGRFAAPGAHLCDGLERGCPEKAREGVFPINRIADDADCYLQAGGSRPFSDYYRIERSHALFKECVMESIVFAEHNLGTDGPFNLFQAILCRRALGAFNEWLQERVRALFMESLSRSGVLALGIDGLPKMPLTQRYERLPGISNLYRKVE